MNLKKRRERYLLEQFIEASALSAEIVEDDREAPDFFVRFEGRLVGIEVTQVFVSHDANGRLPQAQETISSGIVSRARQMYLASGSPPAYVKLCVAPRSDLRIVDRRDIAAKLCAFVRRLSLDDERPFVWRPRDGDGPPAPVSYLHALRVPTVEMAHWTVARAGWVAALTSDALQSRVDDKSKRLPTYREAVTENWLLIVADGKYPSQMFEIPEDFDPCAVSSPFSRTFYYGHPERVVIELGTSTHRP